MDNGSTYSSIAGWRLLINGVAELIHSKIVFADVSYKYRKKIDDCISRSCIITDKIELLNATLNTSHREHTL